MPVVEGREQRLLVDEPATGRVDEHGAGLHRREGGRAEHAARILGQGDVDGDDIGGREERVERVGAVDAGGDGRRGKVRIEHRDPHPEAARDPCHVPGDPAEADEAQDLAVELDAGMAAVVAGRRPRAERRRGERSPASRPAT